MFVKFHRKIEEPKVCKHEAAYKALTTTLMHMGSVPINAKTEIQNTIITLEMHYEIGIFQALAEVGYSYENIKRIIKERFPQSQDEKVSP
jgi:hypothetical protein